MCESTTGALAHLHRGVKMLRATNNNQGCTPDDRSSTVNVVVRAVRYFNARSGDTQRNVSEVHRRCTFQVGSPGKSTEDALSRRFTLVDVTCCHVMSSVQFRNGVKEEDRNGVQEEDRNGVQGDDSVEDGDTTTPLNINTLTQTITSRRRCRQDDGKMQAR